MNTSFILSYAFMYFVLFIVAPMIVVTFVMTCIKFFRSDEVKEQNIDIKAHAIDKKAIDFLDNLKLIAKGRYDVIYGTNLAHIIDIENEPDTVPLVVENYLKDCQLDYVLIDHESQAIKLVIADPAENTVEQTRFMERALEKIGVRLIKMTENKMCDDDLVRNALAA